MKTLIHNLVLASILLAAAASPSRGAEAVSQSHLAKIWQDIEKSEYNIRWIEDQHSYKSANRAHNLRATYAADGFTLEPRVYDEQLEKPEITIRLASVKKGPGQGHDLTLHKWQTSEGTAQMDAEEVSIAYINDTSGLRQNFYVKSPPLGHGNLNLTLHIEGQGLTPELDQSEKAINFVDVEKNAVLTYSDLNVWDSLQRKIPARMVQNGPDSFSIIVEDANAVYPIVVDPLTSVGTGWGEHDSYSGSCKFGSVVLGEQTAHSAALIVGAPSFDTASYADAGKVFGYTGTGIPSSANWTKVGNEIRKQCGGLRATTRSPRRPDVQRPTRPVADAYPLPLARAGGELCVPAHRGREATHETALGTGGSAGSRLIRSRVAPAALVPCSPEKPDKYSPMLPGRLVPWLPIKEVRQSNP
jgi:hypothetical protein